MADINYYSSSSANRCPEDCIYYPSCSLRNLREKHPDKCSTVCRFSKPSYTKVDTENLPDGIYLETFVVRDGIRYRSKTIQLKDLATILTSSLMDGVERLVK